MRAARDRLGVPAGSPRHQIMNGRQITTIALVALLAVPAAVTGFSTGPVAQQAGPVANNSTTTANDSAAPAATTDESTAPSTQTASPDADFEVVDVDADLQVGEQGTVAVTIENQGEDAADAVVNLQSQSSSLAFGESATASQFVGEWDEGENRTIELDATVPSGGEARSYPVEATVSYVNDDDDQSQSAPLTFGVTAGEGDEDFAIVSTSSDVAVGDTGNLSVVLENQGGDIEDAVINLQTLSGTVTFGGLANTSEFVGDWEAGEQRTIETDVSATPSARERSYPVQATVAYEDDGRETQAGPYLFGVTPAGEQAFTLDGVDSSLAVGEEGTVSGTITNDGPKNATDATLVFAANATGDLVPRQSEVVLEDISPDGSVDFEYPFVVNGSAEPGERQLPFVVQYRNAAGETVRSERLTTQVIIDDRADEFALENVASNVQVGDTGTIDLTLRNTGSDREDASVTLESSNAQVLFGNSTSATRYVGEWEANETKTVSFGTTATPDASVEAYALTAQVSYLDDGQPVSSQQLSMGISPRDEQAFAINTTDTTLRIDRDGSLNGTVTNAGPLPVSNATIRLSNRSGITSERAAYPVGNLDVGENETFSFPVSVQGGATGPQQVEYSVAYTGPTDNRRTDTGFMSQVDVAPRRPLLTTTIEDPNVTVQQSEVMNVTVTNQGSETLRNVQAVPNGSGSLAVSPTSLFVGQLEPGETVTRQLEIDADDVEVPSRIPLIIDFQYETNSNEMRQTQAPPVGIAVVAAESGLVTGPVVVGAVLLIVVLGGLIWYLR